MDKQLPAFLCPGSLPLNARIREEPGGTFRRRVRGITGL